MSESRSVAATRDPKVLEGLRRRAVGLVNSGQTQAAVARAMGVLPTTVWKWMTLYRADGEPGLAARVGQGRPPKLGAAERVLLRATIIEKTPKEIGLGAELWTLPIIGEHLRNAWGVDLHPTNISRMLDKMGITPQRPTRRAVERSEEECAHWMTEAFPRIVREAKENRATLLFEDETGVHENTPLETTWGERGKRPVVRVSGGRRKINVISAISPYGHLWFRCYPGNLNASVFVVFLAALLHDRRGKIVLILDRHPAHVASLTRKFIEGHSNRLTVHFLPGYAPDLNPDEHVWGYLKRRFRRNPLVKGSDIHAVVSDAMDGIKGDRSLVRSFFEHPEAEYVRKALNW